MANLTRKRFRYISYILFITGFLSVTLVTYFLFQSLRETIYQNGFEKQYGFISLVEDGDVYPIQVFHGVKLNTFVEGEGEKEGSIIFEIKDEPEAKLKGFTIGSDPKGMSDFNDAIQYKVMVEKETGKESFIVAMRTSPPPGENRSNPTTYRTYSINENGVVKESNFTTDTKSKLETQWIRGISGEKSGYYTNLPYQKGGTVTLIFLFLFGVVSGMAGVWLRKSNLIAGRNQAA
jgi:hypothetical protein